MPPTWLPRPAHALICSMAVSLAVTMPRLILPTHARMEVDHARIDTQVARRRDPAEGADPVDDPGDPHRGFGHHCRYPGQRPAWRSVLLQYGPTGRPQYCHQGEHASCIGGLNHPAYTLRTAISTPQCALDALAIRLGVR